MSIAIWTFTIGSNHWSTQDVTIGGTDYTARVIPDSFAGVTERWDISGQLIAPGDVEFDVGNADGELAAGDLEGEYCTISIVIDTTVDRSWKFKIQRAVEYYGKIRCWCADFLQEHLEGSYPNTPAPKEVWPSDDDDADERADDYCIPVVLGTAYIPVRSVNTGTDRYYVLGENRDITNFSGITVIDDFESGLTNWDTILGVPATTDSNAYEGTYSLELTASGAGDATVVAEYVAGEGDTFFDVGMEVVFYWKPASGDWDAAGGSSGFGVELYDEAPINEESTTRTTLAMYIESPDTAVMYVSVGGAEPPSFDDATLTNGLDTYSGQWLKVVIGYPSAGNYTAQIYDGSDTLIADLSLVDTGVDFTPSALFLMQSVTESSGLTATTLVDYIIVQEVTV